jgi:NAD(P)-dependent dehydrogenase (short-subunit alcohol dehydrogenase family)
MTLGNRLYKDEQCLSNILLEPNPIRVNVICPGWINASGAELSDSDHKFHPTGRVGIPQDVSAMCLFLADSSKSGFITGTLSPHSLTHCFRTTVCD